MSKGISIIVCCYNSAQRLEPTLRHIAVQKIDANIHCELVLVNNLSTDDTVAVAQSIWTRLNAPFALRIVHEQEPGLSNARKKGVAEAAFDYLIFCDDDNWLNETYIETAYNIIDSNDNIGIIGCKIQAEFEEIPDQWVIDSAEFLAVGPPQDVKDGDITIYPGMVFGAGMVLRKSIFSDLQNINYQFLLSDRKGKLLTSCGDTELCFCARLLGYTIHFSNQLKLTHYIPVQRTTADYFKRLMFGMGYSGIYLLPYIYALEQKEITGVEKIKTSWYWQAVSGFKELLKIRFTSPATKMNELYYYSKKGRLIALLTLRSKYRAAFSMVYTLKSINR